MNLELLYFKNILGNKKTIEQVLKYCKNNKICNKNKNYLCIHILKIYGYKIDNYFKKKSCFIFKELLEYAKNTDNYTTDYIKMSDELLSTIIIDCSDILYDFLEDNFEDKISEDDVKKRIEYNNKHSYIINSSDLYKDTLRLNTSLV